MKDTDNLQKKLSLPVKALFTIFFTYFFLFRSHASDEAMRTVVSSLLHSLPCHPRFLRCLRGQ